MGRAQARADGSVLKARIVETEACCGESDTACHAHCGKTENFYFDDQAIHFIYNQYEIACYADGIIEAIVPR